MRHFKGRIVAATNRSFSEEVAAGRFRADLMYQLDVFTIRMPPLREHLADIDCLAESLLGQLCHRYNRSHLGLQPKDLAALRCYTFPGNIRELRNLLERSLLRTSPQAEHLAMDLAWLNGRSGPARPNTSSAGVAATPPAHRQLGVIEEQEYQLIAKALISEKGGVRRTAAQLGLTPQALLRRLQKWPELRQIASAGESVGERFPEQRNSGAVDIPTQQQPT